MKCMPMPAALCLSLLLIVLSGFAAAPAQAFTGSKFNQNAKDRQPDVEYRAEIKRCKQKQAGNPKAWAQCDAYARSVVEERRKQQREQAKEKAGQRKY